jgi:hypothetical protein
MKMEQSVPKRRHINFRRRGITQKKAYNIKFGTAQEAKQIYQYKNIKETLFQKKHIDMV